MWRVWGLFVWAIPLALFALRFFHETSGFETLALMVYLPIWYPVLGGLGMTPKWVWRYRAGQGVRPPALVPVAMAVHWVGLLLAVLALRGQGDSMTFPSPLEQLVPGLPEGLSLPILVASLTLALLGLVAAIAAAAFARTPAAAAAAPAQVSPNVG